MERDVNEAKRLVQNARAKQRRVEKKYGVESAPDTDLPEKYSRLDRDFIRTFGERDEFNKWKAGMESYTDRSNREQQYVKGKYGVVTTKADIDSIQAKTTQAQTQAQTQIDAKKDIPFTSRGEDYGTVGERAGHMGEGDIMEVYVPDDFDIDKVRNKQRLDDIRESMERRSAPEYFDERQEKMKENFIQELYDSFHSDADELVKELDQVSAKDFYDMYVRFDEFDFDMFYPPDAVDEVHESQIMGQQLDDINQMLSYVKGYKEGKFNTDLAGF